MKNTVLVLSGVLLVGCFGYQPLYAPVKQDMKEIRVEKVYIESPENKSGERRVAQSVRSQLSRYFTGETGVYDLRVSLTESKTTLAVRRDATEERLQLNLSADVQLLSADEKVLFETSVKSSSPYNVESSPLSTDFGKENARQNVAKVVAEEIRQRVAQYLYASQNGAQ